MMSDNAGHIRSVGQGNTKSLRDEVSSEEERGIHFVSLHQAVI